MSSWWQLQITLKKNNVLHIMCITLLGYNFVKEMSLVTIYDDVMVLNCSSEYSNSTPTTEIRKL